MIHRNDYPHVLATCLFAALMLAGPFSGGWSFAQETWEQRAAKVFKPITPAQESRIIEAVPGSAKVTPDKPRRVLVFYRCEGFIHASIPHGNLATEQMGRKTKAFTVDTSDSYDVFSAENLRQYDAIVLNNTSNLRLPDSKYEQALLDFVEGGKGLVGYHAASDNFTAHPNLAVMIGGQFNGHPWTAGGTWAFKLDDPDHVLNEAFGGKGFWHQDEIYQYRPDTFIGFEKIRSLVSLDMTKEKVTEPMKSDNKKDSYESSDREVPVSWVRKFGKGRVFYTNFGHREETFANPVMLRHMLDGIQFALGDLEVVTTPTGDMSRNKPALAPPMADEK